MISKSIGDLFKALCLLLSLLLILTISACGNQSSSANDSQSPRAVTNDEAYLLAAVLFKNYNAGVRQIRASFVDGPEQINADGWVDFTQGIGYAKVTPVSTADGAVETPFLVRWDLEVAEVWQGQEVDLSSGVPLPEPSTGWQSLPLNSQESFLGKGLGALLLLAKDRPENPQLLQQSSAQWLREDQIDGVPVSVFSGPGSDGFNSAQETPSATSSPASSSAPEVEQDGSGVRYWIDNDGLLRRVEIRIGRYGDFSRIDFSEPSGNITITGPAT